MTFPRNPAILSRLCGTLGLSGQQASSAYANGAQVGVCLLALEEAAVGLREGRSTVEEDRSKAGV